MYRNSEGLCDPTAGDALANVIHERNSKRKSGREGPWPKAYVVSKYSGNVDENTRTARKCCRYLVSKGRMPIASHLLYPQFLDDKVDMERKLGLGFGLELLGDCDEVWCFEDGEISQGMRTELGMAKRLRKKIISIPLSEVK